MRSAPARAASWMRCEFQEAGDLAHRRSVSLRRRSRRQAAVALCARLRRAAVAAASCVQLGERAPVLVREHLHEAARARPPSRRGCASARVLPVKRRWRSTELAQQRLVGASGVAQATLAGADELALDARLLGLRLAPARARPSRCCSARRTCRPRRRRRRCRRSCRRRSCARCGRARRRCRRSCTRSRGRRCPRRPPSRRSCARRSARRPRRGSRPRRRSRRTSPCCR